MDTAAAIQVHGGSKRGDNNSHPGGGNQRGAIAAIQVEIAKETAAAIQVEITDCKGDSSSHSGGDNRATGARGDSSSHNSGGGNKGDNS
jgi:hypothetical protein